jgi:molecular chaperone GrpE
VRDRRRIDPVTGEPREPGPSAPAPAGEQVPAEDLAGGAPADEETAALRTALAERTADLQRLQAEYVNYRRRVDRDRALVQDQAVAGVLTGLLPVLDDIGRARQHGELEGGFKAVAEAVVGVADKHGLVVYGEVGDPFDPLLHEALMQVDDPDVTEPTCVQVLQPGYRLGERVLRPARVAVAGTAG